MNLSQIKKPGLLLDKEKTLSNINRMVLKCKRDNITLRPHFKTHQSREVASWFRYAGISSITVSSADMAGYFADDGWKDILIAFPYNPREAETINQLARRITLAVTIPCPSSARLLAKYAKEDIDVMLKVDTGYGRSGMSWDNTGSLLEAADCLGSNNRIRLRGLLSHSGNTYSAVGKEEIISIHAETVKRLHYCKKSINRDELLVSTGDTPSASLTDRFEGMDEIRPGNFVFYDLMQFFIGSCRLEDISLVCACPVVDIHNNGRKAVIYGGGVHLSKESLIHNNNRIYGMAVSLNDRGWSFFKRPLYLTSLSQEHGIIESGHDLPGDFEVGKLIGIIPVHSCLTANLAGGYTELESGVHIDHMMGRKC